MIIQSLDKKDIIELVKREIRKAEKEIFATMLLREEIDHPLPDSYHKLLKKKVSKGVILKRLGFGTKKDYTIIKSKYLIKSKRYEFRYLTNQKKYQRMIVIDEKDLFFGAKGLFFYSEYKPLIYAFRQYFHEQFAKGGI